jgi:hypothetical protein
MAELKPEADIFKLFYFVGRVNPPQPGHIATLQKMINDANANGLPALIILGSGEFEGERTMDNPITYELKVEFLKTKLTGDITFIKKTNIIKELDDFYQSQLAQRSKSSINSVEFIRYAGKKGDNDTKLEFIDKYFKPRVPNYTPIVVAVPPVIVNGIAGSATTVRNFVYQAYVDSPGTAYGKFDTKYGEFYGTLKEKMYTQIIYPIINEGLTSEQIREYIKNKTLPMSDARRALAARKAAEKAARNAAVKAEKSLATIAASLGNAATARNASRTAKKENATPKALAKAKAKAKANAKVLSEAITPAEVQAATPKATPKARASQKSKGKGQGGPEKTRGGGTKKRRHRKTQKKLSNRK